MASSRAAPFAMRLAMPFAPRGRLFWKLLLALWLSMLLSQLGVIGLFALRDAGRAHVAMPGPWPAASGLDARHPEGPPGGFPPGWPHHPPHHHGLPIEMLVSGALASLLMSVLLAWYLSQPIRHLRWALSRVAQEQFDTRVAPKMGRRRDELVDLAQDFDRMAEQLQRLNASRRQLLHDVSHELRSPLHRLQAAVGLARQQPARAAELLERIQRETERIDALIEELLTLHRLEAGAATHAARQERVDLGELLQAVTDDAAIEAESMGRHLVLGLSASCVVRIDGELVCRALDNIIRNALKYSPEGGHIDVSARVDEVRRVWQCSVKDRGPGVPADMLEAIFQPFVRVEGQAHVQGTGLGLAIAHRAMALHGGRITAHARAGGGLVVTLELPTVPDLYLA